MLNLFGQPPADHERVEFDARGAPQPAHADLGEDDEEAGEEDNRPKRFIKHNMVYYLHESSVRPQTIHCNPRRK